jgi:sugar phosphate permease
MSYAAGMAYLVTCTWRDTICNVNLVAMLFSRSVSSIGIPENTSRVSNRTTIFYGWWIVVLSIFGLTFSVGPVVVYTFGIFVKPLAKSFSSDRGTISLAISFLNLGAAICLPVYGFIIDRIGGRKIIAIGLSVLGICLFLLSRVDPPVWHVLLIYGVIGLIGSGSSPVSFSKVVANWFNRKRGLALGIATTGIGLGGVLLPSLCQYLIERVGWRQAFLILSIPVFVITPIIAIFYTNRPEQKGLLPDGEKMEDHQIANKPVEGMSVKDAMRTRTFWLLYFIYLFIAACSLGTLTHLSPLLTDRGFSPKYAAFATSIFGATNVIGRLINGYLIDKYFAPYVAAVWLLGAAIGVGLLWLGAGGVLFSAAFLGLLIGSEADTMPFLLSRYFGRKHLGTLFGFVFSAFTIGVAVGPYLFGMTFDRTHSYQLPLGCAFIVLTLLTVLTLRLKKYNTTKFN